MARAAVKAKQKRHQGRTRPPEQAAKAQGRPRGRRRHKGGGDPTQRLFFARLRRQAKFMYVLLAVLFAVTFAALGVGSGSAGLDQLFSGLNVFGGGGGTSIAKAQKEIREHPRAAKGYRDLATAYEQKGETANAISALESYTKLRPKDANAFSELASLQMSRAQDLATRYQAAAAEQAAAAPSQPFLPTGKLGAALGANRVEQAAAQRAAEKTADLARRASLSYRAALESYRRVAALRPSDANVQIQLATAAQQAGDNATAIAALKTYLKLNPASPQRAQVERLIKQLGGT